MSYQGIIAIFEQYGVEDYCYHLGLEQQRVLEQIIEGLRRAFPEFSRLDRMKQLRMAGLTVQAYVRVLQNLR
jgi:hypothetical protein